MAVHDHPEASSYQASGFSNRIGWGKSPALIIIDVCTAYWTKGSPLDTSSNPASAESVDVMKRLLAAARDGSVPVIWTTVQYEADMSDAGIFWMKAKSLDVWRKGDTRGFDKFVKGLEPSLGDIVVSKKYPSGFFGTDLNTRLTVLGVDTVVICGVSTSGCVRATTLDAMQHGYRPMVTYLCI